MSYIYRVMALAGLAMTLVPPILFYLGSMAEDPMKRFMFIGFVLWFSGAIPWLGKKKEQT
jgi:hypothetical protein